MARRARGPLPLLALGLLFAAPFLQQAFTTFTSSRGGLAQAGRGRTVGLVPVRAGPRVAPSGFHDFMPLPYAYDALEPYMDEATVRLHYDKHHRTYLENMNKALVGQRKRALIDLVKESEKGSALRVNVGGYYNHNFFWRTMAPPGSTGEPSHELLVAINRSFGSMDKFKAQFEAAGAPGTRVGSGWVWLIVNEDNELTITSTQNQENPLMREADCIRGIPILGCDVWEHAYYLKYQNRRADYMKAWWNIVNWNQISEWYHMALLDKSPRVDETETVRDFP